MNTENKPRPPQTADQAALFMTTRFPKMSIVDQMTLWNMFESVQEASEKRGVQQEKDRRLRRIEEEQLRLAAAIVEERMVG